MAPLIALLLACRPPPAPPGDGGQYAVDRLPEAARAFDGLSGLAVDPEGRLWAVPERSARLVPIGWDPAALDVGAALPIDGLPEKHDVESVAFLWDGTAVIGLEGTGGRHDTDPVAWLARDGDRLRVAAIHPIDWGLWGLRAPDNAGVEGLCADDALWAAGEAVIADGDARFAPLARWDEAAGAWVPARLRLTTDTGKVSGLTCRAGRGLAIERHFGVQRILAFDLPTRAGQVVEPTVIAEPGFDGNLEGIAVRAGRAVLVSDNDYRGRTGDSALVSFVPDDRAPPPRVHLTIDDAPYQTGPSVPIAPGVAEVAALNAKIVGALGARSVSASVFFNCDRIQDGDGSVALWRDAGHVVGNHTASHARLDAVGADAWLADAARCQERLTDALGAAPTLFRYPYLNAGTGPTRDAARDGLGALGLRDLPVTVATTEWKYAFAHRDALRAGDDAARDRLVAEWHAHMDDALRFGEVYARRTVGEPVIHTVLVHTNELVADEIGGLIDRWRARGVVFVGAAEAAAQPVFAREDRYDGGGGVSWLFRVAADEDRQPYWFGSEEDRVVTRLGPRDLAPPP